MDVDRDKWRLVGLMHIADTKEQAYRDVEYGIVQWFNYFQHVAAFPQMAVGDGRLVREMIDFVNGSGLGTIGTVDEAAEQIDRLSKQSGGFGAYLQLAHEWANPQATKHSYELIARHVMPQFQGQSWSTLQAKARAEASREHLSARSMQAIEEMVAKHQAEVEASTKS
jgi:limonene 1,2-monooxygenase